MFCLPVSDVPEGSDVDVSVMTRFLTAGPPGSEKRPGSATDVWQQFLDNGGSAIVTAGCWKGRLTQVVVSVCVHACRPTA